MKERMKSTMEWTTASAGKEKTAFIKEKIQELGLTVSERQAEQFGLYYELLVQWNSFMNLTAITEFEEVVQKHFVDSLSIIQVINPEDVDNLMDVGTGAGFPGIPLKIMYPHLNVTLLDSLKKRIDFLQEVNGRLQLEKIEAIHGRAEDYAKKGRNREQYDLCVSRAVANLSTLSEYCLPYVKIGGAFVPYKSGEIEKELEKAKSAVFLLGGKTEVCKTFVLPGTDIGRSLLCIRKVNGCPQKYPRKSGMPAKEPL